MRPFIVFVLLMILVLLIKVCILDIRVNTLEYKNAKLKNMIDNIITYADSTADTGEFDEFIASPQGEKFFNDYNTLCNK